MTAAALSARRDIDAHAMLAEARRDAFQKAQDGSWKRDYVTQPHNDDAPQDNVAVISSFHWDRVQSRAQAAEPQENPVHVLTDYIERTIARNTALAETDAREEAEFDARTIKITLPVSYARRDAEEASGPWVTATQAPAAKQNRLPAFLTRPITLPKVTLPNVRVNTDWAMRVDRVLYDKAMQADGALRVFYADVGRSAQKGVAAAIEQADPRGIALAATVAVSATAFMMGGHSHRATAPAAGYEQTIASPVPAMPPVVYDTGKPAVTQAQQETVAPAAARNAPAPATHQTPPPVDHAVSANEDQIATRVVEAVRSHHLEAKMQDIAQRTGFAVTSQLAMCGAESSGNIEIHGNSQSSSEGPYQILRLTFLDMVRDYWTQDSAAIGHFSPRLAQPLGLAHDSIMAAQSTMHGADQKAIYAKAALIYKAKWHALPAHQRNYEFSTLKKVSIEARRDFYVADLFTSRHVQQGLRSVSSNDSFGEFGRVIVARLIHFLGTGDTNNALSHANSDKRADRVLSHEVLVRNGLNPHQNMRQLIVAATQRYVDLEKAISYKISHDPAFIARPNGSFAVASIAPPMR